MLGDKTKDLLSSSWHLSSMLRFSLSVRLLCFPHLLFIFLFSFSFWVLLCTLIFLLLGALRFLLPSGFFPMFMKELLVNLWLVLFWLLLIFSLICLCGSSVVFPVLFGLFSILMEAFMIDLWWVLFGFLIVGGYWISCIIWVVSVLH